MPKMPRAKLTKLVLTELAAVPAGAQEIQGTAILKSKVAAPSVVVELEKDPRDILKGKDLKGKDPKAQAPTAIEKRSALTTSVEGHTHLVYGIDDAMAGTTSWETLPNSSSYSGHCHPWVRSDDGKIVLGEALNHTHDIGAMSAAIAKSGAANSTQVSSLLQRDPTTEGTMSQAPDLSKQLADVTKRNEQLERIAKMSGVHKAHYDTLTADDASTFLAKTNAERDTILSDVAKRNEESNKVVYVSKSSGDVFRAKDDTRMVDMAKKMDEQFVALEKTKIRKQALETLGGMPGSDDAHDLIVGSLLKSGAKEEEIKAALEVLQGMKATSSIGKKAPGVNPGEDAPTASADEALEKLEKGLVAFAKSKNISNVWVEGLAAFVQTDEGAQLKRAYDETVNG